MSEVTAQTEKYELPAEKEPTVSLVEKYTFREHFFTGEKAGGKERTASMFDPAALFARKFPILCDIMRRQLTATGNMQQACDDVMTYIDEPAVKFVPAQVEGEIKDDIGVYNHFFEIQYEDEMDVSMFDLSWKGRKA